MNEKPSIVWAGDPNTLAREYITIADILAVNSGTSATNGSITLTLGSVFTGEVYTRDALLFNAPGIYSVPLPSGTIDSSGNYVAAATSVTGAQAICWRRNDQWIVISVRDTRAQTNQGNTVQGEFAAQATTGAARLLLKADSSINLYTLNSGSSMGLFIAPSSNSINMVNSNGYGFTANASSVQMYASTSSPEGGQITITDSGAVSVIGTKQTQIDGANIVLGSIALPTNAVVMNPDALVAALTTIVETIAALQTATAAFTGTGTFPGIAAVATALVAAAAQVSALTALISSQKVIVQ